MLIADSTLAGLRTNLVMRFKQAYEADLDSMLWYKMLAAEIPSTSTSNTYPALDVLPRLRQWVGARQLRNLKERSYVLTNVDYEESFEISANDVADDNVGSYASAVQHLGRSAKLWPNDLVLAALVGGGAAICYDGQYFFDTDHPLEVQGSAATTQANLHTGTALTAANYETVRSAMKVRKAADGLPMGINPTHLIVPQALEATAKKIVKAENVGYLANSSSTATDSNMNFGTAEIMVIPALDATSTTTWYLADLSKSLKPLLCQVRKSPNQLVVRNSPTDDNMFESNVVQVGVHGRGAGGYGFWQMMDKCEA